MHGCTSDRLNVKFPIRRLRTSEADTDTYGFASELEAVKVKLKGESGRSHSNSCQPPSSQGPLTRLLLFTWTDLEADVSSETEASLLARTNRAGACGLRM